VRREKTLRPTAYVLRPLLIFFFLAPAAAAQTQESFGPADPYESRFRTKGHFQIKFHAPEKGGEVRLYTKKPVHYEKDVFWEGSEEVQIEYQDIKITADRARYDFPSRTARLEGHVVIDQGPTRLAGERAVFNVESKTGTVEVASANLPPSYHILADTIDKIGEATYRVHRGVFTACDVPRPDWSFFMSEATVTLDDYARMKDVSFRARDLPLLYTPYMIWPTKEGRVSGLMVPGVGYTTQRGAYLGLTHFWVTGQSTDLTTQVDLFSKGGIGIGEEARWVPASESAGIFQGYFIHDPQATTCVTDQEAEGVGDLCRLPDGKFGRFALRTRNRWKIRLDHVSDDLPWGMRGVIAIRRYSDPEYLLDYERSFTQTSLREVISRGFLTKNEGVDSFNLRLERSETFLDTTVVQERLPTLEYFRRTSQIGSSPLYLSGQATLSNLFINRGKDLLGIDLLHGDYGRANFHPVITFPWKGLPWLSVTTTLGGRWTFYTDSTGGENCPGQTCFTGSSLSLVSGEAGVSLVGPSFSRIYDVQIGPFGKFKHIIEPRVDYAYVSNVADPLRIPVFDDTDTVLGSNQIRYALVNRLLARSADPKAGAASEIASFTVSQTYAFEQPQSPFISGSIPGLFQNAGPVEAALRFAPGALISFDGRLAYDVKADRVTSNTVAATVSWKSNFFNATWFSGRPVLASNLPPGTVSPNSDQLRFAAGVDISKPFRIDTEVNWDVRNGQVLEDRSLLTYRGSCYTLYLEYRQLRLPANQRNDVRFVVNLKDIGTLLDVNGALKASLF
jgi:LPS-assembly protein